METMITVDYGETLSRVQKMNKHGSLRVVTLLLFPTILSRLPTSSMKLAT